MNICCCKRFAFIGVLWLVSNPMLSKLLLLLICLVGLRTPVGASESGISIVTSFSIIDDLCLKLLNNKHLTYSIVPRNGELHEYQLSVQDVSRLNHAKLAVGFSPDSESWLKDWAKSAEGHRVVWLGLKEDGTPLPAHAWTDPILTKGMVLRLATAIRAALPEAQLDEARLLAEIDEVHARLKELMNSVPPERRNLITQHPNLEPFAARYALKVAGTLLASNSGEAADTSARHYSLLLKSIKSGNIRTIVVDEGQNSDLAVRLALDARIPPPLPLNFESLSTKDGPAPTWKDMMLHNGLQLQRALSTR